MSGCGTSTSVLRAMCEYRLASRPVDSIAGTAVSSDVLTNVESNRMLFSFDFIGRWGANVSSNVTFRNMQRLILIWLYQHQLQPCRLGWMDSDSKNELKPKVRGPPRLRNARIEQFSVHKSIGWNTPLKSINFLDFCCASHTVEFWREISSILAFFVFTEVGACFGFFSDLSASPSILMIGVNLMSAVNMT